jgi:hypothetical protein
MLKHIYFLLLIWNIHKAVTEINPPNIMPRIKTKNIIKSPPDSQKGCPKKASFNTSYLLMTNRF